MKCTKCYSPNVEIMEKKELRPNMKWHKIILICSIVLCLAGSQYKSIISACILAFAGTLIHAAIMFKLYKGRKKYKCHCKNCGEIFYYND